MTRYLPIVALMIACAMALSGGSTSTFHRDGGNATPESQAVLYGVGFAHPGAIVRLHQAQDSINPTVDQVLAIAESGADGRWAIRYATTTVQHGLYFSIGDSSGPGNTLSSVMPQLVPAVPTALVVVRLTPQISDSMAVY